MIEFMNRITDEPGWEDKAFDGNVTEKWKAEALANPGVDMSEKMLDWCIAELQYKASLFEERNFVEAIDGTFKSDTIVSEKLRKSLLKAVTPLEQVPDKNKDWHPGSNKQVLDLVHPSLFPLVYGQSRILRDSVIGIEDSISRCGDGETIPIPSDDEVDHKDSCVMKFLGKEQNAWSKKFQWLPSEFELPFNYDDDVRIVSYINNLHPHRHRELYTVIEYIVSKAIPLWNATLSPLQYYYRPPPRIQMERVDDRDMRTPALNDPYTNDETSWSADNTADEAYLAERPTVQPEPKLFERPEDRMCAAYVGRGTNFSQRKGPVNLSKEYEKLQIIVKLANIHLTPEKPRYEGGSWHVEGQLNEYICATALYYYDSNNISESLVAFRSMVDQEEDLPDLYRANDHRAVETIFGFENGESTIQTIGKVVTKTGRLFTFPNIFQHRVEPFHLQDPSKPGHRKILALFLVDPHVEIISTANIPCQQKEWWEETIRDIGPLGDVPQEINEQIMRMVDDFPISLEKAKEQRLELMEERRRFFVDQNEAFEYETFDLCTH